MVLNWDKNLNLIAIIYSFGNLHSLYYLINFLIGSGYYYPPLNYLGNEFWEIRCIFGYYLLVYFHMKMGCFFTYLLNMLKTFRLIIFIIYCKKYTFYLILMDLIWILNLNKKINYYIILMLIYYIYIYKL